MRHALPILALLLALTSLARAETLPAGVPLDRTILAPMVEAALATDGEARVVLERPVLPLGNPSAQATELRLEALQLDAAGERFGGALVGRAGGRERFRLPVAGHLVSLIELPVPARAIARGQPIAADDLDWRAFEARRVRAGVIEDPERLIGKVARRALRVDRPIAGRDVEAPRLVERGRPVRLVFQATGLRLSALGVAEEPGALGEVVRVRNADSHQSLAGVVSGPGEVRIGSSAGGVP